MEQIKVVKGDIKNLKRPVDAVIMRNDTTNVVFDKSKFKGSRYIISVPSEELNEDNALGYLHTHVEAALNKARTLQQYDLAIEAIELKDDDLSFTFAIELKEMLNKYIEFSTHGETIVVVCRTKSAVDIYELAMFGEIRSTQMTMADRLEGNDVIVVPVNNKLRKFHKNYKMIKKMESHALFWGLIMTRLEHGKYYLTEGENLCDLYYFLNLTKGKKQKVEDFTRLACEGITNILNSANSMKYKSVTVPIVKISKKRKENKEFVLSFIDAVCEATEEYEMRIKFYCSDAELWDLVVEHFENRGDDEQ